MVRANRKLTGAVLLASYIAATIGAWSHGRHDCRNFEQVAGTATPHICHDHSHVVASEPSAPAAGADSTRRPSDSRFALGPLREAEPGHFDQCLICQFLAIQKVIESSGASIQTATIVAQRWIPPDQRLLIADHFGTPESRGPPRAC